MVINTACWHISQGPPQATSKYPSDKWISCCVVHMLEANCKICLSLILIKLGLCLKKCYKWPNEHLSLMSENKRRFFVFFKAQVWLGKAGRVSQGEKMIRSLMQRGSGEKKVSPLSDMSMKRHDISSGHTASLNNVLQRSTQQQYTL